MPPPCDSKRQSNPCTDARARSERPRALRRCSRPRWRNTIGVIHGVPQRAELHSCRRHFEKALVVPAVEAGHLIPRIAVGVLAAPVVVLAAERALRVDASGVDSEGAVEARQRPADQALGLRERALVGLSGSNSSGDCPAANRRSQTMWWPCAVEPPDASPAPSRAVGSSTVSASLSKRHEASGHACLTATWSLRSPSKTTTHSSPCASCGGRPG